MENKDFNLLISNYKNQLVGGDIQAAYSGLIKYMQQLKTHFTKEIGKEYVVGNVFPGCMDITYFYVTNDYLKSRKLKLGLVLNHSEIRFEVWLFGQTKDVQEEYWNLFKNTEWVTGTEMPEYSVVEKVIVSEPDFNDMEKLSSEVIDEFLGVSVELLASVRELG